MEAKQPPSAPARAPASMWLLAILLGAASALLDSEAMIALGPMAKSLTSDNDLTRQTAETTLGIFRIGLLAGAALVLAWIVSWRRWAGSRLVAFVYRQPLPPRDASEPSVLNASFFIALAAFAASITYVLLAPTLLTGPSRAFVGEEDGIVEVISALCFLCASCVSFLTVKRIRRGQRPLATVQRRQAGWHALMGVFFFLCCGEEISWGQRIFGFETPDAIAEINVQSEVNLHNMLGYLTDHVFIIAVAVYGVLLPALAHRYEFWRRSLNWTGLPLASPGLMIGFGLSSALHKWVFSDIWIRAGLRAEELRETLTALCFMLVMIECFRRASRVDLPAAGVEAPTP